MNVKQLIAVGALAIGFSSCGLFGNAVQGGPLFSGNVGGTPPRSEERRVGKEC